MKIKYIIWIVIIGLLGFCLFGYNKPYQPLDTNRQIDKIILIKHKKVLQLIAKDSIIKSYKVSLGRVPLGHKEFEGDKKTPEGKYFINDKNLNSGYHKNLGISYPNKQDIEHASSFNKSAGGQIKIHGLRNGFGWLGKAHLFFNWTLGCIAVTNDEIDELYENIKIGTPIEIKP